ncbi:Hypothetical predicted protein [Marmota monax]|uniref:Uncharacterized protein n=1 Tax=Marmota monax TaxID=9995 RepID=A0A5E4D2H0_MARMO|nr:Hypothetical predicted protein [Marmota monax]
MTSPTSPTPSWKGIQQQVLERESEADHESVDWRHLKTLLQARRHWFAVEKKGSVWAVVQHPLGRHHHQCLRMEESPPIWILLDSRGMMQIGGTSTLLLVTSAFCSWTIINMCLFGSSVWICGSSCSTVC